MDGARVSHPQQAPNCDVPGKPVRLDGRRCWRVRNPLRFLSTDGCSAMMQICHARWLICAIASAGGLMSGDSASARSHCSTASMSESGVLVPAVRPTWRHWQTSGPQLGGCLHVMDTGTEARAGLDQFMRVVAVAPTDTTTTSDFVAISLAAVCRCFVVEQPYL